MRRLLWPMLLALLSGAAPAYSQSSATDSSSSPAMDPGAFRACVLTLRSDAISRGIPAAIADRALGNVEVDQRVLDLDRRQPEFLLTFWRYLANSITEDRVNKGRQLLAQHRALFQKVAQRYGVQAEYLVAFWGLESNYGQFMGDFATIRSLATLACDDRRPQFFAAEIVEALRMMAGDHIDQSLMKGSWAGAFGQTQFMPSTFTRFAVDGDGDGRRDLFRSLPDIFNSSANFLSKSGWQAGQRAAVEVMLPQNFPWDQAEPAIEKTIAEWQALGVRRIDGQPLGAPDMKAAIGLPAGHRGPAFLLLPNFKTIMIWNRSLLYGLAVELLAQRIAGKVAMSTAQSGDEPPLSATDIVELQDSLRRAGHYEGELDGLVGPKTRNAIRSYQRQAGLPADGFPDQDLMARLRRR
ncbi:MAG TPA: lytic murein transglycosylase [Candidatus Polarisedimenticolia bacterium]|nr:lytic murein transglycosylase [Candidatus Polarisedimenticolia bacterium]